MTLPSAPTLTEPDRPARRAILDSNVVLWSAVEPRKLTSTARAFIQNPATELLMSIVTPWELAVKVNSRGLDLVQSLEAFIEQ
jgi:PIN domain nuclease of toxin-antitoxin system